MCCSLADPIWRRLLNRTATPDGQNRPPLGRKKWPVCLHSLALVLFLLLQQQQQQLPGAPQSVPALSKPRQQRHPDSRHVKYSSLCRTTRDRCGPENERVAGQKCVNNSLLDALKISPNSKRLKKPHTHKPKTSALLSSQPGHFHSAAWVFCTNNFTVPKWKRETSAWFSYKRFWKQMRTIWKAFSLNVSSANWTSKYELAPLNFQVSFWEERVMKAYQFLIGRQLVI